METEPDLKGSEAKAVSTEGSQNSSRYQLVLNVLLLVFSIVLTLSIAEICLHALFPFGDTALQLDPRYLHRFKPNSRQIYWFSEANGGGRRIVTINSEGRRGALVSMDRSRVLVYGDSFIAAMFSPVKETFVWQLEQKLKSTTGSAPQVVNCGVPGYGPDQESLVLEDEIERLTPGLIIVSIFTGNDFGDLLRNKIYRLDDQQQLKNNPHTFAPSLVYDFGEPDRLPRLYTFRLIWEFWRVLHGQDIEPKPLTSDEYIEKSLHDGRAEYEEFVLQGDNSVRNLLEDHYDADMSLTPNSEPAQYKRLLMDRVIEKMKRVTSAHSVPFLLLIVPSPIDVVDDYAVRVNTQKYPEYRPTENSDAVEAIARKYDIPYINFFKPFHEHGAASLYYVVDNDHWNAAGQKFAADLVADYIKQHHLLDSPHSAAQASK